MGKTSEREEEISLKSSDDRTIMISIPDFYYFNVCEDIHPIESWTPDHVFNRASHQKVTTESYFESPQIIRADVPLAHHEWKYS
jgi:hypothetical protein